MDNNHIWTSDRDTTQRHDPAHLIRIQQKFGRRLLNSDDFSVMKCFDDCEPNPKERLHIQEHISI